MADAVFAHPRLAEIYDPLDTDRSDLDAYAALADEFAVRQALRPGGRLVFESRDPERMTWLEWNRAQTYRRVAIPDAGAVATWTELTEPMTSSLREPSATRPRIFRGQARGRPAWRKALGDTND